MATRLFVGNIPAGIQEEDLKKEFSFYGNVASVDLKQKRDTGDERNLSQFAFVSLEANNLTINKCIQEFSEQKWKGSFLNVSIAKESFLERLKRERSEADKPKEEKTVLETAPEVNISNSFSREPFKINNIVKKEKHRSFGDEEYEYSKKIQSKKRKKKEDTDISFDSKHDISNVSQEKEEMSKPALENNNTNLSNKKRLESIQNMKNSYNQKKSMIKMALSNVDCKKNKKIIFDDNDTIDCETKTKNNAKISCINGKQNNKSKTTLFDEESNDEEGDKDYNFEIKQQFEGESGRKLLELQSRYQSDKRFTLDERFLEDGAENDNNFPVENSQASKQAFDSVNDENNDDIDILNEEEKLKQAEILKGIFGDSGIPNKSENTKKLPLKTMLRFDPSRSDHTKFLNTPVEKPALSKKAKKEKKKLESEALNEKKRPEDNPAPIVSEERYYKINEPLKQSSEDNQPFSLLSLFGKRDIEENEVQNDEGYSTKPIEKSEKKMKNPLKGEKNPFFYDSSDSEDEKDAKKTDKSNIIIPANEETKPTAIIENFFFADDDPRFLEGLEFFLSTKSISEKSRQELKTVVRKRIKNNMRNSNQFHSKKVVRSTKAKFRRK